MCLYFFITGADFGNDEVEEDNTCHHNDGEPDKPEHNVFKVIELSRCIEVEISQGNTSYREDVGKEIRQMLILLIRVAQWIIFNVSCGWIIGQLVITNFKNTKNGRKHQDKNEIEEHEDSQIVKHFPYHGDNITHVLEYPKEKERLNQNQYRHHDQENIFNLLQRLAFMLERCYLENTIEETEPDMKLINVIPFVLEVL